MRIHQYMDLGQLMERMGECTETEATLMRALLCVHYADVDTKDVPDLEWVKMRSLAGPEIMNAASGHVSSLDGEIDPDLGKAEPQDAYLWELYSLPVPAWGGLDINNTKDQDMIRLALSKAIEICLDETEQA